MHDKAFPPGGAAGTNLAAASDTGSSVVNRACHLASKRTRIKKVTRVEESSESARYRSKLAGCAGADLTLGSAGLNTDPTFLEDSSAAQGNDLMR